MALAPLEPLLALDDDTLAAFRARLRDCGFTPEAVSDTEDVLPGQVQAVREPLVRSWLERHPGLASTLLALLAYGLETAERDVREALGDALLARLSGALVEPATAAGMLRARFVLMPIGEQWFCSDPLHAGTEAVMGPGMTTFLLHGWSERFPATRVLDLGCGAGSLAVAAAARGALAVATDLSERAVAMARFNARLNGVEVDARTSDLAAAMAGERFDLVLSQPPYVARPDATGATTYLHGGAFGDELALRFVGAAARVLAPGGVALVLFDFAQRPGARLPDLLREAVGDDSLSQVAIVRRGAPLDAYAMHMGSSHHAGIGEGYARAVREYREHYAALGITGFLSVLLVLVRSAGDSAQGGRPRLVLEHTGRRPPTPAALRALIDGIAVAAGPDAALLAARLAPAEGARFTGEWANPAEPSPAKLRVEFPDDAFATAREIGERGWLAFSLLDGTRTLADTVAPYAEACECDPATARAEVLGFAREGLARGLLRAVA